MLASFQMGLVGGQRALTPLAAVSIGAARGELPVEDGLTRFLAHPVVVAGASALAVAEMAGDKQKTAPDRIVPVGLGVRFVTNAIAGAALARKDERLAGAAVGAATAIAASFIGWGFRMASMTRFSQASTGFVEDSVVIGSAVAIMRGHASQRKG